MVYRKVEVNGQVYTIRKPVGRIGALHFSLITKCAPKNVRMDEEVEVESVDFDQISDVFVVWAEKVLPHLIVDGPYTMEEMPGEDQFALFASCLDGMNIGKDFFRVIE